MFLVLGVYEPDEMPMILLLTGQSGGSMVVSWVNERARLLVVVKSCMKLTMDVRLDGR